MKTQCPHCKQFHAVPSEYTGGKITCKACGERFVVKRFKRPPIVVPSVLPSTGNFITKMWTKSPKAFRTGFLTTLGVISALTLSIYIYGLSPSSRPSLNSESTYRAYSIPSPVHGTGNLLQNLCNLLGELKLAANLRGFSVSENTRNLLITRLNYNVEFQLHIKWLGYESKLFKKAIDSLESAMYAEIDMLTYENQNPELLENAAWYYDKDYMSLMNKAMELRGEADWEISELMGKI